MTSKENISIRIPHNFPECKDCPLIKNNVKSDIKHLTENEEFKKYVKVEVVIFCDIKEVKGSYNKSKSVTLSQGGLVYLDPRSATTLTSIPLNNVECPVLKANEA